MIEKKRKNLYMFNLIFKLLLKDNMAENNLVQEFC